MKSYPEERNENLRFVFVCRSPFFVRSENRFGNGYLQDTVRLVQVAAHSRVDVARFQSGSGESALVSTSFERFAPRRVEEERRVPGIAQRELLADGTGA